MAAETPPPSDKFSLPNICTVQSLMFIILVGALLAIVYTLISDRGQGFNWRVFSLTSFFVLWIILPSVAIICNIRKKLLTVSMLHGTVITYAIILLVTLTVSLTAQWVAIEYLHVLEVYDAWLAVEHVTIAAILAGIGLRYLYLQEQLHIQKEAELDSRIQALQSRIRPHFLFNSMNIIASLIGSDPDLAEEVVEDLSELFRATLSEANQLVPIDNEVQIAENYIHIEQLRLGDRLDVDWDIDDFRQNETIPHLSMQPLLENAIYHGIQPIAEGGLIKVSLRREGDRVVVSIRNPYDPENQRSDPHKGNKLALDNLKRRLTAYYGDKASLQVISDDNTFEVQFSYPVVMQGKA